MKISIRTFRGEVRRADPERLPDGFAQRATNSRLLSGDLEAWPKLGKSQLLAKLPIVTSPPYPVRVRDDLSGGVDFLSGEVRQVVNRAEFEAEVEGSISFVSGQVRNVNRFAEAQTDEAEGGVSFIAAQIRNVNRFSEAETDEAESSVSFISGSFAPAVIRYDRAEDSSENSVSFVSGSVEVP